MLNELAPYFTGTHNLEGKKNSRAWCQSSHQPAFSELCVHLCISLFEHRRGYWLTALVSISCGRVRCLGTRSPWRRIVSHPSGFLDQLTPLTFTSTPSIPTHPPPPPVFPNIGWMAGGWSTSWKSTPVLPTGVEGGSEGFDEGGDGRSQTTQMDHKVQALCGQSYRPNTAEE